MLNFGLLKKDERASMMRSMDVAPQTWRHHLGSIWITETILFAIRVPLLGIIFGIISVVRDNPFWYGLVSSFIIFFITGVVFGLINTVLMRQLYNEWQRKRRAQDIDDEEKWNG